MTRRALAATTRTMRRWVLLVFPIFNLGFIMITSLCLRDILEMLSRWTSACKPTTLVMWPGVNISILIYPSRPVLENKIQTFWLWSVLKTNNYSGEYPFAFAACLEQVTIRGNKTIYSSFTRLQFETRWIPFLIDWQKKMHVVNPNLYNSSNDWIGIAGGVLSVDAIQGSKPWFTGRLLPELISFSSCT